MHVTANGSSTIAVQKAKGQKKREWEASFLKSGSIAALAVPTLSGKKLSHESHSEEGVVLYSSNEECGKRPKQKSAPR